MASSEQTIISGKSALVAELGYWPEFCDAKIIEVLFCPYTDDGAELALLLHYIDMDLNRDLKVKIIMHGISDMNFSEFRTENVIDRLSISDSFTVEVEAAVGLSGCCQCKSVDVEVVSSKPFSG